MKGCMYALEPCLGGKITPAEIKPRLPASGWMSCDFTSFSTVSQSYWVNGQLIMKCCVQAVLVWK